MNTIPKSFEEWRICIEERCGIPLTLEFAEQRLAIYSNEDLPETVRFAKLYGNDHLQLVKHWFSTIVKEKQNP